MLPPGFPPDEFVYVNVSFEILSVLEINEVGNCLSYNKGETIHDSFKCSYN